MEHHHSVGVPHQYKRLWPCVRNQLISRANFYGSLTIILFLLRISKQENYFSMPPSTDTARGGGKWMYACFAGVWIAKSWYKRKVAIKLPVTSEF